MSVVNSTPLLAAAGGEYQIERSLRFRSSASAYLNRTPASAGNRKTFTISFWMKRGSGSNYIIRVSEFYLYLAGDNLNYYDLRQGSNNLILKTNAVYRDFSAWYHVMLVVDTTQATASNRSKLYVNGDQVTSFSTATYQNLNEDSFFNSTTSHLIGGSSGNYFDGYLTEINFIDGQALTPSSFGEYNATTGVWQPIEYAGTYGTNGFYLNFSDNSAATAAAIGKDSSGNGNNWTPNNISVTSGATYDSMIDVPTPYADGGNGRGNYCTLNPVNPPNGVTISGGNLNFACSDDTTPREAFCTIGVKTGKWYFEATKTNSCDRFYAGIIESIYKPGQGISFGKLRFDTSSSSNITIMFAVDFDAGLYWGGVSGTFTGDPSAGTGGTSFTVGSNAWVPLVGGYREEQPSAVGNANFGQRPFAYTPPTGFKVLNTQNLPESTVVDGGEYFNTVLWTGNATARTITGVGFQPDLVWAKSRSLSYNHRIFDVIRGATKTISSNLTDAESTESQQLTAFNADGFSLGTDNGLNQSSGTYVAWNWKANGAGVSNTDGSITSTVSANPTAGFSVVTYTGTGAAATVGHGLGVAPKMIITKNRSASSGWLTYHSSVGAGAFLSLASTSGSTADTSIWQNTNPSSTVFSVGTAVSQNTNNYVAYCFSEVAGYSAFGSYTGNGSADGPFVFCGFRPAFILMKRTDTTFDWYVYDSKREGYNAANSELYPNDSSAETTGGGGRPFDLLSNGFKFRNSNGGHNASGGTYIFMAFAENPFKNALAR